jgi:hypothetical protein
MTHPPQKLLFNGIQRKLVRGWIPFSRQSATGAQNKMVPSTLPFHSIDETVARRSCIHPHGHGLALFLGSHSIRCSHALSNVIRQGLGAHKGQENVGTIVVVDCRWGLAAREHSLERLLGSPKTKVLVFRSALRRVFAAPSFPLGA